MSLFEIVHEHRLRSPAEAEAWFRALGAPRVSARGFRSADPERFQALVAAASCAHEHTISFERGTLDERARAELEVLVDSPFAYLDLRTVDANLRVWPERHSWVHANRAISELEALLGARVEPGKSTIGDLEVEVGPAGRYAIMVETTSRPTAYRLFCALSEDRVDRGFVNGLHEETKAALGRFLGALRTEVDAVLDLDLAAARRITERYAGVKIDWQADGMVVDLSDGKITTYVTSSSDTPEQRRRLRSRIDDALRGAKLV